MKTVRIFFSGFLCCGLLSAYAAQSGGAPTQAAATSRAQELMNGVLRSSAQVDRATVGHIEALGLQSTAANVGAVQQLLARKPDRETAVSLIYLLGSLYTQNDRAGQNAAIARSLKATVFNGDQAVATAALLSYSRTDHHPDRIELLDYGLSHNLLNENDYCRELALGLQSAPFGSQVMAATRLASSNNQFGADILAMGIAGQASVAKISPDVRVILINFLNKREPSMPAPIGEFGITDGIRFTNWLTSMALLKEANGQGSSTEFIRRKLSSESTDPRKTLSYLTSPEGERFMRAIGSRAGLAQVTERALTPTRQFPGHPIFTEMGQELNKALAELGN